jgi:hypothetical protein
MWAAAGKAASSRLPTFSNACKFAGGMLVFDMMYVSVRGYDAPWVGDPKKKTWSWSIDFDENDPAKTCKTYFRRSDPERPHLGHPVRIIRSKRPDQTGMTATTDCSQSSFDTAEW